MGRVHAGQLLFAHQWRLHFLQAVKQLRRHQLVLDGDQALRAFRVAATHIVLQAVGVADKGGESTAGQVRFEPGEHARFLVALWWQKGYMKSL
ncbi:hypothetical protein D3C72_1700380 [compost metagenome]